MAVIVVLFVALCISMITAQKKCTGDGGPFQSIEIGNSMYYQTDVWNSNGCSDGWWECIFYQNGQTIVEFELWPKEYGDNSVKAYPSIVAGWNFGSGYKYGYGAGGLPFAVSANKTGSFLSFKLQ